MKARWSSPRGENTSRKPNFALFARVFLIFFLIRYHLNRKRTIFQLNWTEGVAYRNFTILVRNLKHHLSSKLGGLEVEFRNLPVGKPHKEGTTDHKERKTQHDPHESSMEPAMGQTTCRNPNFALFAVNFFIHFF
jgi:hypothetical protein